MKIEPDFCDWDDDEVSHAIRRRDKLPYQNTPSRKMVYQGRPEGTKIHNRFCSGCHRKLAPGDVVHVIQSTWRGGAGLARMRCDTCGAWDTSPTSAKPIIEPTPEYTINARDEALIKHMWKANHNVVN